MIARIATLAQDMTYARYIAASAGALGVDMALFLLLIETGSASVPASILGYSAGIAVHWLLSSRAVFTGRTAQRGRARYRQKVLFLLSALAGLAITAGIVGMSEVFGLDPRIAKLVAIAVSFQATWLIRHKFVFKL